MIQTLMNIDSTVLWILGAYYLGVVSGWILGRIRKHLKPLNRLPRKQDENLDGFAPVINVLAKMIRHIVFHLHITDAKWNRLMKTYLDDPLNGVGPSPRERSTARGNLNKDLRSSNVTWSTFVKFIRFMNPKSAILKIEITQKDGSRSEYTADLL